MFKSPAELAVALEEGREFKTIQGNTLSYDSSNACPFRFTDKLEYNTLAMNDIWNQYNKVTEILKEVDWDKVPRLTDVLMKEYANDDWESCKFLIKLNRNNRPFVTVDNDSLSVSRYCELDPDYPVMEEWYK